MEKYLTRKNIIILTTFLVVFIISLIIYKPQNVESKVEKESILVIENKKEENLPISFSVDVKGAVKKPGVYNFNEGDMIIDAIKAAGGILKNATTKNINLSKKLKSEMVIYIFTNSELKKKTTSNPIITKIPECVCETIEINNCLEDINNEQEEVQKENEEKENNSAETIEKNKKIDINKASLEELQTLPGIGPSKAQAIIKYREETTFITIEDLMNVSGIGTAFFEKLKHLITVNES